MTTKSVGNNRLLKLADFLETLPPKSINMDAWWQVSKTREFTNADVKLGAKAGALMKIGDEYQISPNVTPKLASKCGFAACAVGWAATYKPFRRAGFKMVLREYGDAHFVQAEYKNDTNDEAVTEFFGLGLDHDHYSSYEAEWEYLFGPDAYDNDHPSPARVANRIRKFVDRRKAGKPGLPKSKHINVSNWSW